MSNFTDIRDTLLGTVAPTLVSALLGPLSGVAVAALGKIMGVDNASVTTVTKAFQDGKLTPDQLTAIKQLEMQYQNDEKERGFKYAELEFQDRDSARKANVAGGVQKELFGMSLILLLVCLGTEIWVLFNGYPETLPEIIVGRILGLLDGVALLILGYWYGTSNSSHGKDILLANAPAPGQ